LHRVLWYPLDPLTHASQNSSSHAALTVSLTTAALVAFAANSVLCRLALGEDAIDPYAFTGIRLGSGALILSILAASRRPGRGRTSLRTGWISAIWLVLYAVPFSVAYTRLDAGTGALLLFGAVQLTMLGRELVLGRSPRRYEWVGLIGALAGVVYLVSPGLRAPDPVAAGLMVGAGVGWGSYTIAGKGVVNPVASTAANFRRAALFVVPVAAVARPVWAVSVPGAVLAVASGALASGLGYAVWYTALRHISVTRAALVQLAVPPLAAAGGVAFIGETITFRLFAASAVILGSIGVGILARR
jgi:drug/metabolite transporter (DMT)-like permease